jgi:DNA-directed RNA polymerase subunit RPC12/RpoP
MNRVAPATWCSSALRLDDLTCNRLRTSPVKPRRFFDPGAKFNYSDEMLVNCPKCGGVGRTTYIETPGEPRSTRQFTCSRCSHRIV